MVKHLPTVRETRVRSLGQEDPLEKGVPIHSSSSGKFHGQRYMGYSQWGPIELDMTEHKKE